MSVLSETCYTTVHMTTDLYVKLDMWLSIKFGLQTAILSPMSYFMYLHIHFLKCEAVQNKMNWVVWFQCCYYLVVDSTVDVTLSWSVDLTTFVTGLNVNRCTWCPAVISTLISPSWSHKQIRDCSVVSWTVCGLVSNCWHHTAPFNLLNKV